MRQLLISSHISNSNNLAHLTITSSRLTLAAASESRQISDLRPHLRQLLRQLTMSRTQYLAIW